MDVIHSFGRIRVDAARRTVCRGREKLHVTPKEFDILLYRLENSERVVSREELLAKLWPGVVVEESNLTQNIFLLRKALGETPPGGPLIETIPRRGYRISVPVKKLVSQHDWPQRLPWIAVLPAWSAFCYWLGGSHFSR